VFKTGKEKQCGSANLRRYEIRADFEEAYVQRVEYEI